MKDVKYSVVVPAKAGTHIPEAGVWGTMGPRLREDDGAWVNR
jgi:hypothetical protein